MKKDMTIEEILAKLKEGNEKFTQDKLSHNNQDAARRAELVDGQDPFAIILSCADSRVVPELAFDTGLGELFVARVAGNVANTSTIASIEYSVFALKTKVIVVMGHESCGAVGAAVNGGDLGHNLNMLLAHVTPALAAAPDGASVNDIVKINAKLTVKELIGRSSIIGNAVKDGKLAVVPAYYNFASGKVDFLDEAVA
ncbi:MAG: carbonic anhydrase [Crocinitomicaceae bacterium]|nr:carbonic anhydrase [Crocinitomicaceae bacterium]